MKWKTSIGRNPATKRLIYQITLTDELFKAHRIAATMTWNPRRQGWNVTLYTGAGAEFFTDEGSFKKPPKKMIEALVSAGR